MKLKLHLIFFIFFQTIICYAQEKRQVYYYENGKVKEHRNYVKGKLEGEYRYYYSSGMIWIKNNYKNGLLHGERKVYYENGELEKEEQFKNGFNLSGTYH